MNHYHFFATFQEETTYQVYAGTREIGTIHRLPEPGSRVLLAGGVWQVKVIDADRRRVEVMPAAGKAEPLWKGSGVPIHTRIRERMRSVLTETTLYPYLLPRAQARLAEARALAVDTGLAEVSVLPLGGSRWLLLPWVGSQALDTLALLLERAGLNPQPDASRLALYVTALDEHQLRASVRRLLADLPDGGSLIAGLPLHQLYQEKFDPFIPEALLREAYIQDRLDLPAALAYLRQWA